MSLDPAISIRNLVKRYAPSGKALANLALDGVSFDVPQGEIFGLLGPNGAGKSTLINILAGLVMKSAGEVSIWGFDIDRDHRNAKRAIGIVPQEIVFDPFFTPFEVLENQAGLYGVPRAARRSLELLGQVHLADKRDAYARTLSGGMKRRLLIAKALVHAPPVIVLDEPTAGVDVELRRDMWRQIDALRSRGTTIVLTTHYIEEAQAMADRVGVIDKGRLLLVDDKAAIMAKLGRTEARIRLVAPLAAVPDWLGGYPVTLDGGALVYRGGDGSGKGKREVAEVLRLLVQHEVAFDSVETRESSLEDIFVDLVENRLAAA
jgi:ABC-2 type transport system ATP-binding protein